MPKFNVFIRKLLILSSLSLITITANAYNRFAYFNYGNAYIMSCVMLSDNSIGQCIVAKPIFQNISPIMEDQSASQTTQNIASGMVADDKGNMYLLIGTNSVQKCTINQTNGSLFNCADSGATISTDLQPASNVNVLSANIAGDYIYLTISANLNSQNLTSRIVASFKMQADGTLESNYTSIQIESNVALSIPPVPGPVLINENRMYVPINSSTNLISNILCTINISTGIISPCIGNGVVDPSIGGMSSLVFSDGLVFGIGSISGFYGPASLFGFLVNPDQTLTISGAIPHYADVLGIVPGNNGSIYVASGDDNSLLYCQPGLKSCQSIMTLPRDPSRYMVLYIMPGSTI